ncbi:hypothetical protein EWM63_29975 [Pseudoduganella lutea]|uniref:Uncharacterized protein n=1 Tax=Pseudoduganella lutea TaxID=321985 RepID=A0A4P6L9B8_9BURK|nr:hypothetical protein EWM63_29975 [Pseudoduganella lutea]
MHEFPRPGQADRARLPLPFWVRDFALIRPAVITFIVTAGISFTCVLASHLQLGQARRDEQAAHAQRDAARSRFLYAESEKQEIRAYQPLFVDLRRRRFVGMENRLDWVDAIRRISENRRLLPLAYEIDAQQPYKLESRLATGDYQLRGSRMTLHMDMLHELDLFYFLGDLRQHGVFTVEQCTMRRAASTEAGARPAVLSSDCTLNWLTLTPGPRTGGAAR